MRHVRWDAGQAALGRYGAPRVAPGLVVDPVVAARGAGSSLWRRRQSGRGAPRRRAGGGACGVARSRRHGRLQQCCLGCGVLVTSDLQFEARRGGRCECQAHSAPWPQAGGGTAAAATHRRRSPRCRRRCSWRRPGDRSRAACKRQHGDGQGEKQEAHGGPRAIDCHSRSRGSAGRRRRQSNWVMQADGCGATMCP